MFIIQHKQKEKKMEIFKKQEIDELVKIFTNEMDVILKNTMGELIQGKNSVVADILENKDLTIFQELVSELTEVNDFYGNYEDLNNTIEKLEKMIEEKESTEEFEKL